MGSRREHSFQDRFIEIPRTARDTAGDRLAHDPPQLSEKLKTKKINKQPMVQTSRLLAVGTGVRTTTDDAPVLPMLLHKMAKRPRQVKHQLRTLLQ